MLIADFWMLDAQCLCLTIDAFAGSAPIVDDVVERTVAIEESSHQPAFLPVGVFHVASAFGDLGMFTGLASPFGKE